MDTRVIRGEPRNGTPHICRSRSVCPFRRKSLISFVVFILPQGKITEFGERQFPLSTTFTPKTGHNFIKLKSIYYHTTSLVLKVKSQKLKSRRYRTDNSFLYIIGNSLLKNSRFVPHVVTLYN